MRFFWLGIQLSSRAQLDSYEETLFIQPIADYLTNDSVLAQFDFTIRSPHDGNHSDHFDIFPKSIGKILNRLGVKQFVATLTQGRWKDNWGEAPVNIHPPGATMFIDGTQWREVCPALGGVLSASLEAMTIEHQSYRWIQPSSAPWINGYFASMPFESTCTENLTSLLKLLPCKGRGGLASLLKAIPIAESPFKSIQISGSRGNGLYFRGTLQVVLPQAAVVKTVESCIAAEKSTVWVRQPEHVEVHTQAYRQDGWVLHSVPLAKWGQMEIAKLQAASVSVARQPTQNQRIVVERDILSKPGTSERTHGIYSVRVQSKQTQTFVRFSDQLPWFIQPLWSTIEVTIGDRKFRGSEATQLLKLQLVPRQDSKAPGFFHMEVPCAEPIGIRVEVLKEFIASKEFFAGCEKGFDLAAAVWHADIGVHWPSELESIPCTGCALKEIPLTRAPDLRFTGGLLVMVPMPDFSMPFNVLAVSSTVLTLFYTMLARATMQGID